MQKLNEAAEAQLTERIPVWEALSEFVLDTELRPADYERISKILAGTQHTENQRARLIKFRRV